MEKVLLGLSGGKDSQLALKILKEANFEVIALTMIFNNYSEMDRKNLERARKICKKEEIKHEIIDVSTVFEEKIKKYFIREYISGKTPSPCIYCNEKIKFHYLNEYSKKLGIKFIATGHFADIYFNLREKRYVIRKALYEKKDQSYFLYRLPQEILSKTLFPLGKTVKNKEAGYSESQEICFVSSDYREFFKKKGIPEKEGKMIYKGKIVGKHNGIWNYTIGQRRGLGVSLGKPLYVVKIDAQKNSVILGDKVDLLKSEFEVSYCNWILWENPPEEFNCFIKIRSQFKEKMGKVKVQNKICVVKFLDPQPSITPGQSAVFYTPRGDLIGGGTIK